MKNKIFIILKKRLLTAWIIILSLSLVGMIIASADYPSPLATMKRVIASTSDYGMSFSSNILVDGGEKTYVPSYVDELPTNSQNTSTYDVEVNIWNYSIKNPLDWYKNNIVYNLSFSFTNRKGEALSAAAIGDRTVQICKGTTSLFTLNSTNLNSSNASLASQTLTYSPGNSDSHNYTLKFKGTWNLEGDEDICVQMKATPDGINHTYTDLSEIAALIGLKKTSVGGSSGWTAYLNEHRDSTSLGSVGDFDGYNLVVTGSGAATITIKWDTSNIELNKYFYDTTTGINNFGTWTVTDPDTNVTTTVNEMTPSAGTITIKADSGRSETDHRTRYNIQVYKSNSYEPNSWDDLFALYGSANYDTAKIKVQIVQTQ